MENVRILPGISSGSLVKTSQNAPKFGAVCTAVVLTVSMTPPVEIVPRLLEQRPLVGKGDAVERAALLLEDRGLPWLGHIGRHRITQPNAAPTTSSEVLTGNEAITRLMKAGLACGQAQGPRLHVLGGTNIIADRDIRGYDNAFAILAEPDGRFLVLISSVGGYHDEESTAKTLAEAVDTVITVYRSRGALGPAGRGT